eukprot:6472788-Amphidinium_carterae.2
MQKPLSLKETIELTMWTGLTNCVVVNWSICLCSSMWRSPPRLPTELVHTDAPSSCSAALERTIPDAHSQKQIGVPSRLTSTESDRKLLFFASQAVLQTRHAKKEASAFKRQRTKKEEKMACALLSDWAIPPRFTCYQSYGQVSTAKRKLVTVPISPSDHLRCTSARMGTSSPTPVMHPS